MLTFDHLLKKIWLLLFLLGCKKEIIKHQQYNALYEVNPTYLYQNNSEKTQLKSADQFISILHADLFNYPPSSQYLNDLSEVFLSFGDKGLMNHILLENLLTLSVPFLPSSSAMRSNPDQFVVDTYLRFYNRLPTEYEKHFFVDFIQKDTTLTPQQVFSAFVQSNEYLYY